MIMTKRLSTLKVSLPSTESNKRVLMAKKLSKQQHNNAKFITAIYNPIPSQHRQYTKLNTTTY